jgi:hypothetical protein
MRPHQDRRRENGCAEGAHADLVHADDETLAVAPECVLRAEMGLSDWHAAMLPPRHAQVRG